MGRIKRGLDYFPLSTGFIHDRMVRRVMRREGDVAFAVLIEIMCYIYVGNGYYVSADEEFYNELEDGLYNTDVDDVKRIIALSVECGLFDAGLFRQCNILTSADIQRQYLFITKRRSHSPIAAEHCLLEAEELSTYRSALKGGAPKDDSVQDEEADAVTKTTDAATISPDFVTVGTQNKRKQNKANQTKTNHLPNPPEGGNEDGKILKERRRMTQEDIDRLQPPNDGEQRNFQGLMENLRSYKISPSEQYAIILKSNFGIIGNPVWKGLNVIRGSNGKIKLPGHYLLSVVN